MIGYEITFGNKTMVPLFFEKEPTMDQICRILGRVCPQAAKESNISAVNPIGHEISGYGRMVKAHDAAAGCFWCPDSAGAKKVMIAVSKPRTKTCVSMMVPAITAYDPRSLRLHLKEAAALITGKHEDNVTVKDIIDADREKLRQHGIEIIDEHRILMNLDEDDPLL